MVMMLVAWFILAPEGLYKSADILAIYKKTIHTELFNPRLNG